ncbi:general transcription factor 3C polypeptide 1-like isoform X2 [Amphibalanus amphitrite]|uniref:general transcription factor 3C polypeptide 1-like isoform X2 n=1 Tax=Amphibalanus amphitrite TaxID=1232801 RepID=UPI001C90EF60|nr:general transcription factor 3C polypeptide 1-like isoform X2 [Amphibalanus amphitrite]XP_043222109.1 general transcription factor 3C polypeptide 1-like isoform X2 [Amphibalanus amphitrite]XP_043222118.1 general transcription factor 3C polypeptide 1-like isoform X2 [Amphibalanus amphitrite]
MARSGLDSLDYCAVTLDEIALEGLDGITLPALWTRLSNQPNFGLSIDEASTKFLWKVIRNNPDLEFFQLPEDRPDLVLFNRFEHLDHDYGIVVEPSELPEDPYPFAAVDDQSARVRGSCSTYHERIPVTELVADRSLEEVEQRFGRNRLVVVASQSMRNAALVPLSSMDVEAELNLSQFVLLERIGRSRFHGEITVGVQGLGVLKEPPKNLYYLRKKLLEYRLITKQGFCMRGSNGKNCQGRLYHLPRFFREFRPKYEVMIEQAVEILRAQPKYLMLISDFIKLFDNPFGLKKVAKMSEFQRFIKWEMVPHRLIYPDAPRSEWIVKNTGQERSCRVYRLLDPKVSVREALEEADDENDPDGDALKFPDQSTISLQHSLERQAFNLLHVYGSRGIDSNTLRRELGQTPLDARALLKSLANIKQSVETFREDVGRTRITKYVASRYVHMSDTKLEFSMEEQRLKTLTVKTDTGAPPEPQLPQLSPADPVFVMPCGPADGEDFGPPVLTPAFTLPSAPSGAATSATKTAQTATKSTKPAAKAGKAAGKAGKAATAEEDADDITAAAASEAADAENKPASEVVSLLPDGDNLIDMEHCFLELIDPTSLQPISPPKSVIPLEQTELFSKSSSSRLVKRTRIILEIVQKLKIIDNAYQLRRMVQNSEDDQGILTKMDRKSFNRILKRLSDAGLVKNYRLTLSRSGQVKQRHMIADQAVGPDNTLLKSTIEQAKAAFLVQLGVTSAMQAELPPEGPPTDGLAPDVASSVREYHARFLKNIGNNVEKPHVRATKRKQNETYFVPKFRRLQMLQELLFYISRDYAGNTQLDQTEPRRQMLAMDPELDPETLPRAYTNNIDWMTFIGPLPTHASWGRGWSLLCDVLIRMPLCIFLRMVNIPYFTPTVHRYMAHRVLRNLPPTHLPEDVVSCLFWKRKYMFSIHDDITRLVFMGLAQLGQQMLAKDQVFVFCNRNASLLDTSISKEGYHRVDPDIQYPVKMYHFDSLSALKDYWFDLKTIALSTALGSRNLVAGQKITIEIPFYKPALVRWAKPRTPDQADGLDQGEIPGDQLGAGGIDTSMFAHVLRNWKWRRMAQLTQANKTPSGPSGSSAGGPSTENGTESGPARAAKRRRHSTGGRRRPAPKLMEPPSEPLGPVVDVHIHKPADGSAERPVMVTRGRNVPRSRATRKRPAENDSEQPGPSQKRRKSAMDAFSASHRPGLAERRLRVFRPNQKTKFERIMGSKKKRGPKPPRDEIDKKALQLLKKQRCDWSERENTYLLLARVALGLLVDTYKVPSRQYMTVRDALHETIEESRNKTAHAVHRRIAFMLRRPQTVANVSLTIQEHLLDPDIRAIIHQEERLTQNSFNTEVVFPQRFRQVMAILLAKNDRSAVKGDLLPADYAELTDKYDIVLGDNVRLGLVVPVPALISEGDVHLHTVAGLVVSYLTSREDKSCPMTQLYHASQQYPEELMFAALTHLRTSGVASQRRGHAGIRVIKESKGLLHPTSKPYILSTKFRHKFIQRYQYGLYSDCFNFFKTLLWNSLKEEAFTSIGGIQRGGQAAMIFSLMANNQLAYEVSVPENLIRLSRKEQEQGSALIQDIEERQSRQEAPADDGHMSLGRTGASGQKRVGLRSSMSRLVLLAARESQDTELAMADGDKAGGKDTHEYHEQLHIVPFTVLGRLVAATPPPPAADGETGDGSMEVDEQFIPVTPLMAQATRDKHARMLSARAPPVESVLTRLKEEGAITTEESRHIKHLLSLLDDAGVLGMPPEQLLLESGLGRAELRRLCELMVRHELLLRCGVGQLVYVSRAAGQPWVLHSYHLTRTQQDTVASRVAAAGGDLRAAPEKNLQSVYFLPVPWRRISGSVNRRVLDRLSGAILSHCMTEPGASLAAVQQFFHPMLTGFQIRLLVETLAEIGCVKLTETRQLSRTTLFSKRTDLIWYDGDADDFSAPENVVIQPTADATLKYACFVGDKPYAQEFLDTIGL